MLPHAHGDVFNINPCRAREEKHFTTPKQTKKQTATQKHNPTHKQSCGAPKTATPTQKESYLFTFGVQVGCVTVYTHINLRRIHEVNGEKT
jgi:hypothetical protein